MKYLVDDPDSNARQIAASLAEAKQIAQIAVSSYREEAGLTGEWPMGVEFVSVYEIDDPPSDLDEIEIDDLKLVAKTHEVECDNNEGGEPTCEYEVRDCQL